ncbi:MAG: carboxypeptidase-like regulatory domain-containing protein [Hymenobacter sp.]|nr:carboxypeptidase-like regulatory domain-containing protein [Hymenobacter sp.]
MQFRIRYLLLPLLLLAGARLGQAQQLSVQGRVTEAATGKPVPFASVFVPGTTAGTTADAEGRYALRTAPADTVVASAMGFAPFKKILSRQAAPQTIDFALGAGAVSLGEVLVRPTENPAYVIMRRVQQHKPLNDKQRLDAFEFDSYNRTDISLNNLPAQVTRRKVLRQMTAVADSLGLERGADGKPIVPIFASEMLSRYYAHQRPVRRREEIRRTQMRGMAPRPGSVASQIMGSSFQDWDFYPNWQQLLGKDFISPIADGWKFAYEYELQDSVYVGRDFCYQLAVTPRRAQDLAFTGTIWITAGSYALRRVELRVSPEANLNFVDQLTVWQELTPTPAGPWLPLRTRIVVGIRPTGKSTGVVARFTTINSNFEAGKYHPLEFYALPMETATDAFKGEADYFDKNRPDSLSVQEEKTLMVLDSVRKLPAVRSLLELTDVVVNGYYRVGKLDVGPVLATLGYNNIEGIRPRIGFRTTAEISRNWTARAYLAYGLRDTRFKYGLRATRILDRRSWTTIGFEHRHDLDQVALLDNDYALENPLFEASARIGNISSGRPLLRTLSSLSFQTDLFRGFTQKVTFRQQQFRPLYRFAYYTNEPQLGAPTDDHFGVSEVVLESRYAPDEVLVQSQNQNYRSAIGLKKLPVFTVRYTLGLNRFLGGDFQYHKLNLLVTQSVRLGQPGRTDYTLDAGYIPSTVPYPVLKAHLGNQSPFYNGGAYNLMRYFEFVSDRYVGLRFDHHFEGFLLNSVPALKKLNWRLVATGNVLYGGVDRANNAIIPELDPGSGEPLPRFQPLGHLPYAEVGYGVENIFRVLRVDFLHRLTYRDSPGARNFGAKFSFQFRL